MAQYYSVKCSYGANEQYYHKSYAKHDHNAQARFVTAAKDAMATANGTTSDNISTTQIQSGQSRPKTNSIEL